MHRNLEVHYYTILKQAGLSIVSLSQLVAVNLVGPFGTSVIGLVLSVYIVTNKYIDEVSN